MLTRYVMSLLSVCFFLVIVGEVPGRCADPPVIKPLKWHSPGALRYRWNKGDKDTVVVETKSVISNDEKTLASTISNVWSIECVAGTASGKLRAVPGKLDMKVTLNGVSQFIDPKVIFPLPANL